MVYELRHYGILGMRWGVRRSASQLGRANRSLKSNGERTKKSPKSRVSRKASSIPKVDLGTLTDNELREKVDRLILERNYAKLTSSNQTKGLEHVKKILGLAGDAIGVSAAASGLKSGKSTPKLDQLKETVSSSKKIIDESDKIKSYMPKKPNNAVKSMSSEDLRKRVNRLNLEKSYKDLTGDSPDRSDKIKTFLEVAGTGLGIASSSLAIALAIKKLRTGG